MTTQQWPNRKGRFEELSHAECLELLGAKRVGRVAMCGADVPQVFPVNYTMRHGCILFRTAPQTQMAILLRDSSAAAFQVDEIDDYLQCGWSVLLSGRASHVTEPGEPIVEGMDQPEPWANGLRTLLIRIDPEKITGRRVHPT
jgi:nitroimidazol reductase NimA-like FMN-containing flavoprotein (pyridoxamine 5'-phosphate oxidase superfamily)